MSNLSAYPSYSAELMYLLPVISSDAPFSMNPSVFPMVLQVLAQLRTAPSEWNAWKIIGMSAQSSLRKEQQLRLKDKRRFHAQEEQMLHQIESLRSQLDKTAEANAVLHRDMKLLQQNLSICKDVQAENSKQDLEHVNQGISSLKEDILSLTKVMQKKDALLLQTMEESKRNKEKLHEALQRINDKDAQLEDIREERKTLKESLELAKEAIANLKVQERKNQPNIETMLEEKLNVIKADLKNTSECDKSQMNEALMKFKEEITKLKAEEQESHSQLQSVLEAKLNVVNTLTEQVQLNEELRKQKEELHTSLAALRNKSEADISIMKEELRICKETVVPVIGSCGPAQLREIKIPQPDGELYKTALKKQMVPGCVIQVIGRFKSTGDTASINLDYLHGIALHMGFRLSQGHICRNTYSYGKWGSEETGGGMPVRRGQQFNVTITSAAEKFHICVNGVMFATYKHRIETKRIAGIWIHGAIELQEVLYFAPTNI